MGRLTGIELVHKPFERRNYIAPYEFPPAKVHSKLGLNGVAKALIFDFPLLYSLALAFLIPSRLYLVPG